MRERETHDHDKMQDLEQQAQQAIAQSQALLARSRRLHAQVQRTLTRANEPPQPRA